MNLRRLLADRGAQAAHRQRTAWDLQAGSRSGRMRDPDRRPRGRIRDRQSMSSHSPFLAAILLRGDHRSIADPPDSLSILAPVV